jgi:hypothetical protein
MTKQAFLLFASPFGARASHANNHQDKRTTRNRASNSFLLVLLVAMPCLILQAGQPQQAGQRTPDAASPQKLPPNVKMRVMNGDDIKKSQLDSLQKAKVTLGTRQPKRMPGLKATRMDMLNALEEQKAFIATRPQRAPATISRPTMVRPSSSGPSTLMSAGSATPGSATPGLTARSAQPSTGKAKPSNSPMLQMPPPVSKVTYQCQSPAILDVNGKPKGTVFTPQGQYNYYVIKGCFFGVQQGQAYLVGNFNALKVDLQPTFWTDNEIDARVDPNVAGELDQDNVALVIASTNSPQIKVSGYKFYATRSDPAVFLDSIPQSSAWLRGLAGSNTFVPVKTGNFVTEYISPVPNNAPVPKAALGTTLYVSRWDGHSKFQPVSDLFFIQGLAPGWDGDSFQVLTFNQPPSCPGVVTYNQTFGAWNWYWEVDDIRVDWPDTSCSGFVPEPPVFPLFVSTYSNMTGSAYAMNVWVRGPRCTDPHTGKPQQKCIQNVHSCGSDTCGG